MTAKPQTTAPNSHVTNATGAWTSSAIAAATPADDSANRNRASKSSGATVARGY
jgi:hypothetical protein